MWEKLLNPNRRKSKHQPDHSSLGSAAGRADIERDFDRILFCTPTRRLADKTQVFPLDKNDSVRTRLTHSYEVSNLARSIGMRLAFDFPDKVFGHNHEELNVKRSIPALLGAIGLAHDLGNPPFGHQGERAIQKWFTENSKIVFGNEDGEDFKKFDGNAQSFRLLTRLQILNDNFGLNLTYSTLAALIKYPTFWKNISDSPFKKAGVFISEKNIVEEVWSEVGLGENQRHPLTYIMEACDDIAYSVLDAEDTVKKGYASFYDLIDFLDHHCGNDANATELISLSKKKNKEFKNEKLSPSELNDISMQMFRVKAISLMVESVVQEFVDSCKSIMDCTYKNDLMVNGTSSVLCKQLKKFDFQMGYKNKNVLKLELEGANYIHSLMDMLWYAIDNIDDDEDLFANFAVEKISENYRRVFYYSRENSNLPASYIKAQLLADAISGMTDSYLISLHNELKPLYDRSKYLSSEK